MSVQNKWTNATIDKMFAQAVDLIENIILLAHVLTAWLQKSLNFNETLQ